MTDAQGMARVFGRVVATARRWAAVGQVLAVSLALLVSCGGVDHSTFILTQAPLPSQTCDDRVKTVPGSAPRMIVAAKIVHGEEEVLANMLVDTGAAHTVVSREIAERLDLDASSEPLTASAFGKEAAMKWAFVDYLVVGEVSRDGVEVVFHVDGRSSVLDSPNYDGLIGASFLSRFDVVTLDYPAGALDLKGCEPALRHEIVKAGILKDETTLVIDLRVTNLSPNPQRPVQIVAMDDEGEIARGVLPKLAGNEKATIRLRGKAPPREIGSITFFHEEVEVGDAVD